MNELILEKTNDTPFVHLNKKENKFSIGGRSLPENAITFYEPILNWLENYIVNPNQETIFEFNFEYFNSASSKQIFNIVFLLKKLHEDGKIIKIKWIYDLDDELIEEEGKEFEEMFNIPFEYITQ
jgi:hypothetical protein